MNKTVNDYLLKRSKRARSLRVRVESDGEVVVTAPPLIPKVVVDRFVRKSEAWIKRQQDKMKMRKMAYPNLDWDEGIVRVLGVLYKIEFRPVQTKKVTVGKGVVGVNPVTGLEADMRKTLLMWLKRQAESEIIKRLKKWSEKMEVKYNKVRFRQQKSRWGSCSHKGNLNFNWRLIHFDSEVVDYVVIHELTHLVHRNHSRRFWQLVEEFDPLYKKRVKLLKNQHIELEQIPITPPY